MARRRLLPAVLLLGAAAGLAFWLAGRRSEESGPVGDASHETREVAPEAPRLIGREDAHAASAAPHPEPAEDAAARTQEVRVIDRRGEALARALVTLGLGDGREVGGSTDAQGRASLTLPAGTQVTSMRVSVEGLQRKLAAYQRSSEAIELGDVAEVVADGVDWLVVRTVDSYGRARSEQRILFRPGDGEANGSWWGETSDAQGLCRIGPFATGSHVEVRPGPRGLSSDEIWAEGTWRTVTVDGTPVDLFVGDDWKLRLAFTGVAQGDLSIAVLDAGTGEPLFHDSHDAAERVWTAPALAPGKVFEVFVGPLQDGRYARLTEVRPMADPIDVALVQGVPVTGRLVSPLLEEPIIGKIAAFGRGFEVAAELLEGGRFRFSSVPDEPFRVRVEVLSGPKPTPRAFVGEAERVGGQAHVEVHVVRTFRVRGHLVLASETSADAANVVYTRAEARSPTQPRVQGDEDGAGFDLLLPAGQWELELTARDREGGLWRGGIDLGEVEADREGMVVLAGKVVR